MKKILLDLVQILEEMGAEVWEPFSRNNQGEARPRERQEGQLAASQRSRGVGAGGVV